MISLASFRSPVEYPLFSFEQLFPRTKIHQTPQFLKKKHINPGISPRSPAAKAPDFLWTGYSDLHPWRWVFGLTWVCKKKRVSFRNIMPWILCLIIYTGYLTTYVHGILTCYTFHKRSFHGAVPCFFKRRFHLNSCSAVWFIVSKDFCKETKTSSFIHIQPLETSKKYPLEV